MATTRFIDHVLTGDQASRPAASAVPQGTLYACSTHDLIYQSDGTSAWSTWASLGGVADILDLTTAETDDSLVLAPDGAGGVEFRAETGGSGGAAAIGCSGWVTPNYASTNALSITIPAQASGKRIVLVVGTRNNDVTSVSCTNVTWTDVQGWSSSTSTYLSVYVGVATGTTGTTITVNVGGTNFVFAAAIFIDDALTPTVGNNASFTGTASTNRRLPLTIATTPGEVFVMAYTTSDASAAISQMETSAPSLWVPDQSLDGLCGLHLRIGKATSDHVSGWYDGGNGSAIVVGLVGIS